MDSEHDLEEGKRMKLTLWTVFMSDTMKKLNFWTLDLTLHGLDRTTLDKVLSFSKSLFFKKNMYLFPIYLPQHFSEAKMRKHVCVHVCERENTL